MRDNPAQSPHTQTPRDAERMNTHAALLSPIADSAPSGDDLSFSSEFDAIEHHRHGDDPTLDQGEWKTDLKVADWARVEALCLNLLQTRTKDLRVVGWLTEAWMHRRGLEGLAEGLGLCADVCETFWSSLHPQPDGQDHEERIGNLGWLLGQVVNLSQAHVLVDGGPGRRYGLRELEAARSRPTSLDDDDTDPLCQDALARALQACSADLFVRNLDGARQSQQALARLQTVIDAHLGMDGPSFVSARTALEDVKHAAERLARETGVLGHGDPLAPDPQGFNAQPLPADASAPGEAQSAATVGARIQSRAQALQQLKLVADYFRRTEPHSPVAYLADKAVHWGNMPLHVWLRSVLKDGAGLAHVEELLGVDPGVNSGS